jgi:hypothetical protein
MNWDAIGSIATVGGTILALVMAYQAFKQLRDGANNSKGEFILNLQQVYVDNSAYADLFEACWKNYSDDLSDDLSDEDLMKYLEEHDKDVLNYLTFFESIFLMTDCNVLDMKILDELFGRRFFIVVNNRCVQNFDLVKNKPYYENVYSLYKKWKKYREDNGNDEFFIKDKEQRYMDLWDAANKYWNQEKQ